MYADLGGEFQRTLGAQFDEQPLGVQCAAVGQDHRGHGPFTVDLLDGAADAFDLAGLEPFRQLRGNVESFADQVDLGGIVEHGQGAVHGCAPVAGDGDHRVAEKVGVAVHAVADAAAQQFLFARDVEFLFGDTHGKDQGAGDNVPAAFEFQLEQVVSANDFEHIFACDLGPEAPGLLQPGLQQFGTAGDPGDKGVIFDVCAVQGRVFDTPQHEHADLSPGGVNRGLDSGRAGTDNDHVIGRFCHNALLGACLSEKRDPLSGDS